jgi:hypothetical protein
MNNRPTPETKWYVTEYPNECDFAVTDGNEMLAMIIGGNTIGDQCDLASRIAKLPDLERERDEAREELSLKCQSVTIASGTISDLFKKSERLEKQIEGLNNFANERFDEIQRVRRERDEAREQNAKLREIAEWFANHFVDECWHLPHEDHEVHDKSVLSCCPVIEKGYQLRAELDQIKEGRK